MEPKLELLWWASTHALEDDTQIAGHSGVPFVEDFNFLGVGDAKRGWEEV